MTVKQKLGRVLVVDDSAITVEAVTLALTAEGWEVRGASSGAEAFALMEGWAPETLVLDLHMPDLDGFSVLDRIAHGKTPVPVVVLSGDEDLAAVLRAVREGAFDYVLKAGMDFRPLLVAVERAVSHGRLLRENQRLAEDLRRANAELEERVVVRTRDLERAVAELRRREEELEASQAELRQANASLVEAAQQKNRFLASVSHELRTPLNAIMGFTRIVRRKAAAVLDEQQAKNLDTVENSSQQLLSLVNDMLDFQKIESGVLNVSVTQVACMSLASDIEETLRPQAEAKGLRIDIVAGAPLWLHTDPVRLRQILLNLVDNAIKNSERGRIRLEFKRVPEDKPREIRISVSDEGVGIAKEDLERIFEPFQRVESAVRPREGAGLGLAIVRRIAELLGGRVEVKSKVGVGSTFTLVLPGQMLAEPVGELTPTGLGPVVLVIDDNMATLQIFHAELSGMGFRIHVATSGEQGLRRARELKPDAILLDIVMPGMDGWQVLRELRRDPGTAPTPVVVTSIHDEMAEAQQLGVVAWLTKPVQPDIFQRVMERVLTDRRKDVLVVAADSETRDQIERQLRSLNVRVRHAASGTQALAALDDRAPQAVVVDLTLPDMNATDLVAHLREKPGARDTSIVIYTGKALTTAERQFLGSVLAQVVSKQSPDSIDRIVHAVGRAITAAEVGDGSRTGD